MKVDHKWFYQRWLNIYDIQVLPHNTVMRESATRFRVYTREIVMYRDFFHILREVRGDRPIPLDVPAFYHGHSEAEANTCLIIEELKAQGFRTADKLQGCDFDHAKVAVRSLAHYHSLSITAVKNWTETSPTTGKKVIVYPDQVNFLAERTLVETDQHVIFVQSWLANYIDFAREVQRPDVGPVRLS